MMDHYEAPEAIHRSSRESKSASKERDTSYSGGGYFALGETSGELGNGEMSAMRARKSRMFKRRKATSQKPNYDEDSDDPVEDGNYNLELSRISERVGEEESRFIEQGEQYFEKQVLEQIKTPLSSQEHERLKEEIKESARQAFNEMKERKLQYYDELWEDIS